MKKLLIMVMGLGLLSQQASAAVIEESVTKESFAGYANRVLGTTGSFLTDKGSQATGTDWSSDIEGRITDDSAGTNIVGTSTTSSITLGFDVDIVNGTGADLKLFFVGGNGHGFDVTIGGVTVPYSLAAGANPTDPASVDPAYPTDPIIAMAIDLSTFGALVPTGTYDQITVTVGSGYLPDSAVLSFIGTYNTVAPVPVPAAVWLFGSGLIGLVGIARRKQK